MAVDTIYDPSVIIVGTTLGRSPEGECDDEVIAGQEPVCN